jgi:hypothetical protein
VAQEGFLGAYTAMPRFQQWHTRPLRPILVDITSSTPRHPPPRILMRGILPCMIEDPTRSLLLRSLPTLASSSAAHGRRGPCLAGAVQ